MRKSIVAILAVAIIGALGIYTKGQNANANIASAMKSADTKAVNTSNPAASTQPSADASSTPSTTSGYKDGTYTGKQVDTLYGPVRIQVVISGGKIADVKFVSMPDDRGHTQEVTNESAPLLKQSTLSHQSANIDFVSGATQTSEGYQQSLQSALDQAA